MQLAAVSLLLYTRQCVVLAHAGDCMVAIFKVKGQSNTNSEREDLISCLDKSSEPLNFS